MVPDQTGKWPGELERPNCSRMVPDQKGEWPGESVRPLWSRILPDQRGNQEPAVRVAHQGHQFIAGSVVEAKSSQTAAPDVIQDIEGARRVTTADSKKD